MKGMLKERLPGLAGTNWIIQFKGGGGISAWQRRRGPPIPYEDSWSGREPPYPYPPIELQISAIRTMYLDIWRYTLSKESELMGSVTRS